MDIPERAASTYLVRCVPSPGDEREKRQVIPWQIRTASREGEDFSEYILYSLESSFTSYALSPEQRCPSGFSMFKNNCRLSCYTD